MAILNVQTRTKLNVKIETCSWPTKKNATSAEHATTVSVRDRDESVEFFVIDQMFNI